MTRTEVQYQDLPGRLPPIVEKILRTGSGEDIRRRIYLYELPSRFQDYARVRMDTQYGQWPTNPPQSFTLLDYVSLNTQAEQQSSLYGPETTEQMQLYGRIGEVVNYFASEARKKLAAGIDSAELPPLEGRAYDLWHWGSQYIRETVVMQLNDRLMTLPERIIESEKAQKTGMRKRGAQALQVGGPYVAKRAIAHAVQHTLLTAGIIAETAVTGGAGLLFRFTVGQLGLYTINTALDSLKKSRLANFVFDQGGFAEIKRDGPQLEDAYREFMLEARRQKLKVTVSGKKGKPKEVLVAPPKQHYFDIDALHTAQAVYYYQSPMDFARGPHAHWSAAYLGLRLGQWEADYRSLLVNP